MMPGKRAEFIFILFLLISQCSGQKFTLGSCPTVTSQANLALDQLVTNALTVYASTPNIHSQSWTCAIWTITRVLTTINYSFTITGRYKLSRKTFSATGTINVGGSAFQANTGVGTFLTIEVPNVSKPVNYYILAGQDAVFYALYSCQNVFFGKIENVLILTASAATPANIQTALTAVSNIGYPLHALKLRDPRCFN